MGCLIQSYLTALFFTKPYSKTFYLQGLRGICLKAVIIRVCVEKRANVNFIHVKVSAKHLGREPRIDEGVDGGVGGLVADTYLM